MLSDKLICPHCGHHKTGKEDIITVPLIGEHLIHLFCIKCGMGYQLSTQDGLYKIEAIQAEEV
jgi:transcription elongation factor Elf1